MVNPIDIIASLGVVPVIAIERASDAVPLADALLEGGLPIAEITFRTSAAAEVIARIRDARPELCVGAGTLLDRASLELAIASGAQFGLAPGIDPVLAVDAAAMNFPFAPGVMTPSDVTIAIGRHIRLMKFFPAGTAGGPKALAAIAAPFNHLKPHFIPTGGVSPATIGEWLALSFVVAVGGTWIATSDDIRAGRFAAVTKHAAEAVALARRALEARA